MYMYVRQNHMKYKFEETTRNKSKGAALLLLIFILNLGVRFSTEDKHPCMNFTASLYLYNTVSWEKRRHMAEVCANN